jgi:SAM-dependent methyltransferase
MSIRGCAENGMLVNLKSLRSITRRSISLATAYYLVDDLQMRRRLGRKNVETSSGMRHHGHGIDEAVAYIERVWEDYCLYAGQSSFPGRFAELGPGDNFGVALLALASGAEEGYLVDRYRPYRNSVHQASIYRALSERHALAHLFNGFPAEEHVRNIHYRPGTPAEEFFSGTSLRFDTVFSRAVLEHLRNPIEALDDMLVCLNPGGLLVHRVDLRDHGMYVGHHPLTFLTIPELLWPWLTQASGRPNRALLPQYRRWAEESAIDASIRITRLVGVEGDFPPATWENLDLGLRDRALRCVREIKPRLAASFRRMNDEDLAVAGFVLVVRRDQSTFTGA